MAGATRASAAACRLVLLLVGGGWLLAAGGGGATAAAQGEELPVDLELVLAVDASGSIDAEEARRQREGYVAAIADEAVARAIQANFHRRIAVLYLEWAGARRQRVVVDWTLIGDAGGAGEFAAALAAAPLSSGHWTSISGAIDFAVPLIEANGYAGERRVVDVSGDGPNNRGRPVRAARDEAVARGIVINGLPILDDRTQPAGLPTPAELALDDYYRENVVGGPGAFVIPVQDFADFRAAVLRKLIHEIAGAPPGATGLAAVR